MKHILLIFLALACSTLGYAQGNGDSENGQIEDAQIIIQKDKEIILPRREKVYFQPDLNRYKKESDDKKEFSFADIEVPNNRSAPTFAYKPFDFASLNDIKVLPFYGRLGGGNYSATYAELFAGTKEAEKYYAGVHIGHHNFVTGPIDKDNSGQSFNRVDIDGGYNFSKVKLTGSLNYNRERHNFYGYGDSTAPGPDDIKILYQEYGGTVAIEDRNTEDQIDFTASLNPYFVQSNHSMSETGFDLKASTSYKLGENDKFNLEFTGLFLNYTAGEKSISRNMNGIRPSYVFKKDNLKIEGGFAAYFENDTSHLSKAFHLYPMLKVNYQLSSPVELYAAIDGQMNPYSLKKAYQQNPWLDTSFNPFHINEAIIAKTGVNVGIIKNLYARAEVNYRSIANLPFYMNTGYANSRFVAVYDSSNVGVFSTRLGLDYYKAKHFHAWINGDYSNYSMDKLKAPWHRPEMSIEAGTKVWLKEKLSFGFQLLYLQNIAAYDLKNDKEINLGPIFDLDLSAEYFITKHFGTFVRFDNLAFQKFERYNRYQARGFQVLVGISAAF